MIYSGGKGAVVPKMEAASLGMLSGPSVAVTSVV